MAALAVIVNRLGTPSKERLGPVQPALLGASPFTSRRSRSDRKVQFQDSFERVKMPNGEKIQLNRQAYNNMRVAQKQLLKSMDRLCGRDLEDDDYEQSPMFQALVTYDQFKKNNESGWLDEVGRQLRGVNDKRKRLTKTPTELQKMLAELDLCLKCMDDHLANVKDSRGAWRKLSWDPVDSSDPDVEAARACLKDYRTAISQLYSPIKAVGVD